jgi:hypothetical protein
MSENKFIATKDELTGIALDTERNLNELRQALNSHAAALEMHRFLLERFIPAELLEKACNEWYEIKTKEIEAEKAKIHGPVHQA